MIRKIRKKKFEYIPQIVFLKVFKNDKKKDRNIQSKGIAGINFLNK